MKKIFKNTLLYAASILLVSNFAFADTSKEISESEIKNLSEKINVQFKKDDEKYVFLKEENKDVKYEIVYFFSYACPFCYHFDPLFEEWSKNAQSDTSIIKVPATFQDGWDVLANAYTIKEKLKLDKDFDKNIFKAIHEKKYDLKQFDALRSYFINNYKIDYLTFNKEYNSFSSANKKAQYDKWADDLLIEGTPTILVITNDGTVYRTSPGITGDDLSTIVSLEYILRMERQKESIENSKDEKEKPVLQ